MKTNVQPDEFDLLDLCIDISRSTNIPVLGFDTTYDMSTLVKEDNGVNFGGIGGNIGVGKTKKQKTDDDDDDDDEFSFPFKPENDSEDEKDEEDDESEEGTDNTDDSDDESEEGTDNTDDSDEDEKDEQEVEISGADETSDDNFGEVDKNAHASTEESDDNPESGSEYSSTTNFGVSLLILAQKVHLSHLNANTSFAHELMGDVYTYMEQATDSLLETIMSDTGSAINPTNDDLDLSGVDYDRDNVVSFLEGIVQQAEALIESNEDHSAIVNILSELVEKFKTYIYKLKRLED